jgi:hypothetical protein
VSGEIRLLPTLRFAGQVAAAMARSLSRWASGVAADASMALYLAAREQMRDLGPLRDCCPRFLDEPHTARCQAARRARLDTLLSKAQARDQGRGWAP